MILADTVKLLAKGADIRKQNGERIEADIQSVGDLVRIVECQHHGSFHYRGQACDWPLLPTLTRDGSPCKSGRAVHESCRDKEKAILNELRSRMPAYQSPVAETELELAIRAQHHGAPTRLLDWTLNPLAALYFAVRDEGLVAADKDKSAVVWAAAGHRSRVVEHTGSLDALPAGITFLLPNLDENRAAVQRSIFALWNDPGKRFDEVFSEQLWKIQVPRKKCADIRWMLHSLGIDEETLFPDLDGLGRYASWKHRRVHYEEYLKTGVPAPRDA
jgi:hypothetical protein